MQPAVTKLARPATSAFVCSGCLQSRQHLLLLSQSGPPQRRIHPTAVLGTSRISRTFYSTSTTNTTTQSPSHLTPPPALVRSGIAPLHSRRLISVSGPDAAKYLQGVITANITQPDGSPRTTPFYAAFLTAKGRVLHDVFIYPYDPSFLDPSGSGPKAAPGESFLIEVDTPEATRLVQHIKRYKLRAKFDVRLLYDSQVQVWHVWSGDEEALKRKLDMYYESHRDAICVLNPDPRAPGLGYRIISRPCASTDTTALESADLPLVPESAYTLHRYRLGIPEGQREILRDKALPLESNIDVMGGIDFRKGCYVGQELTIRTKHRGVVRKRILPVVVSTADSELSDGFDYRSAISSSSGSDDALLSLPDTEARIGRKEKPDRRVGQFLSGIGNVGLALCRLEVMTDLQVPGEPAAAGYNPEKDEFVVSAGSGRAAIGDGEEETAVPPTGGPQLRVRAFVPEWLRKELEKPAH
ncbi:putative transferase CAF17, mitochondrial [Rhypophila sp. PSN 637]